MSIRNLASNKVSRQSSQQEESQPTSPSQSHRKKSRKQLIIEEEEREESAAIRSRQDAQIKITKIKDLLQHQPDQRSQNMCEQIGHLLDDNKFLRKYMHKIEFLKLCQNLYLKEYREGDHVFDKGDEGDSFYIILQGEVSVNIEEPTEYRNFTALKEVCRFTTGGSFGEIALESDCQRTATIIATQHTDLIALSKEIFKKYIHSVGNTQITKKKEFLKDFALFSFIPPDKQNTTIAEFSTKCENKKYPSNTIIMRQGDDAVALYFVRSGRLKVVQMISFRINPYTRQRIPGDSNEPTEQEIKNGEFVNEFIEIDELSDGDIFGDYAMLNSQCLDYSIITAIPSELVYISVFFLKQLLADYESHLDLYKKSLKKYPNNRELRQIYWEKRQWESFRTEIVDQLLQEKRNRRGFQKSLRQPMEKMSNIDIPLNKIDIKTSDNRLYFNILKEITEEDQESSNKRHKRRTKTEVSDNYLPTLPKNIDKTKNVKILQQLENLGKSYSNYVTQTDLTPRDITNSRSLPNINVSSSKRSNSNSRYSLKNKY